MMTAPFRRKLVSATFSLINKMKTILSPQKSSFSWKNWKPTSREIKKWNFLNQFSALLAPRLHAKISLWMGFHRDQFQVFYAQWFPFLSERRRTPDEGGRSPSRELWFQPSGLIYIDRYLVINIIFRAKTYNPICRTNRCNLEGCRVWCIWRWIFLDRQRPKWWL